ncbi:unnamed protein product [Rhodiola kirilowii]
MGRAPATSSSGLKKGPWTTEEDLKLKEYIDQHGAGNWRILPQKAGLQRCGKSCRLRWTNYLRPDIKRGRFSFEEEEAIIQLHSVLGNKWSAIAARLPGRTDNEIKNYWNTHIRKRLLRMGLDPVTHGPRFDHVFGSTSQLNSLSNLLFVLNQQQQQQQMVNPQLLNIVTTLLSLNHQQQNQNVVYDNNSNDVVSEQLKCQADGYYVPQHDHQLFQSPAVPTFPAFADDVTKAEAEAAASGSFGWLNNNGNGNNQQLSSSSTPFTSHASSPLESSYFSSGLCTDDEIDSVLNFEIPEGFDLSELLYN